MVYYLISALCLVTLIAELAAVIVSIIFKKRAERISFVRSFKRGKCAVIYVSALPLYFIGEVYGGQSLINALFSSVSKIINLVVLRFDIDNLPSLVFENPLYRVTLYFCFVLVTLNAILFSLSLVGQYIWNFAMRVYRIVSRKEVLFLFGANPENVSIYESDKNKRAKAIVGKLAPEEQQSLYAVKCSYLSFADSSSAAHSLIRRVLVSKRSFTFIVNTHSDEDNLDIVNIILGELSSVSEEKRAELFSRLRVFVFGDPAYESVFTDIVRRGYGCVHYVNKYRKLAMDFIDRYPLSRFLDERQIDYSTSYVKSGVDINVFLIGFGKSNRQLLLSSVANNQFITAGKDGAVLKPVNYYIFDKNDSSECKNLNHTLFRFKRELSSFKKGDYLPLPELPANEKFIRLSVGNREFYSSLEEVIKKSADSANFVIIAFGSDLENIDMAKKLVEKRVEWGADNLVIFVKSRRLTKEGTMKDVPLCHFIGNEREVVYNVDNILNDKIYEMARLRNAVYDLEYEIKHNKELDLTEEYVNALSEKSNRKWYISRLELERESSLYCCLSLRSKLNMMGLDCVAKDENGVRGLTELEYLDVYANGDMPDFGSYKLRANGKRIVNYTLDFHRSRRTDMAIQEHLRWNSYMLSKGIVPSSKDEILNEQTINASGKPVYTNGKNYACRRHGNLTTFEGLVEFRRMIAGRDKISDERECDVISYDYQLLDDAYWLLDKCGYKIIPLRDSVIN